jgi:NDP-sugar pyrophosphorylase family protein
MAKSKIAISVDALLLKQVDSKVDGSVIRSRSQAIEFFLKKGIQEQSVGTAVILLKGSHQSYALKEFGNTSLISRQISFFSAHGITKIFLITQHTKGMNLLLEQISSSKVPVEIVEREAGGTADALVAIKDRLESSFVVMSGDTYNNFDLAKMIKKHLQSEKIATMGLMTREKPGSYGTAILDGDLIIDFQEKPRHHSTNIVNAGIYIFKPEIFEMLKNDISLEKDTFQKIARIKQLIGFFTYGEYKHFGP